MVNGEMPQEILEPHPAHELFDELRAVLFGKLRPEIGFGQNDDVRVVPQRRVAEINQHLRIGPGVDAGIDDFNRFGITGLLLKQGAQNPRIGFLLAQTPDESAGIAQR